MPAENSDGADQFEWPLARGKRLRPGPQRDHAAADLRRRYDADASIRDLINLTGRSYGFVHRLLTEAGTPLRPRGGDQRSKR
ncbi:helix-turn-helix domain-containing protein [Streptomyces sp. NPDC056632]|uniref:helix-turn-helix domain-containing protein n=1 Tax=Streptomyces sp. NPDC056632 TaxID=3345884 RepID=UPI0036B43267